MVRHDGGLKINVNAPGLGVNLFPVRKLTQQGMSVVLKRNSVEFRNESTEKLIKTGTFRDNLWWIDFNLENTNPLKRLHEDTVFQ